MSAAAIAHAEGKLHTLLLEHRGAAVFERVKLYVAKFSNGKKLSEYVADPQTKDEDKLRVLNALVGILEMREFDRLPTVPAMNDGLKPTVDVVDEIPAPRNGEEHEHVEPDPVEQMRAIARKEARAELADVLEKVAKVLRETL